MGSKAVANHLLFHKAIVDDHDDGGRYDRYMDLAMKRSSKHIDDPIDSAFFHLFDVVVKEEMDPWSIDLSSFCKEYLKRLRGADSVNFIITGRILFMAYQILKMKSDELAQRATVCEEESSEPVWDIPVWFDQPEDVDYSSRVLKGEIPLSPSVSNESVRPVSLMELVDALEEAKAEALIQMRIAEYRKKCRRHKSPASMTVRLHEENIHDDIEYTWAKIREYGSDKIPFHDLYGDDVYDFVTVFMSLLFLAQSGRVALRQGRFPKGEIVVHVLTREEEILQSEDFSVTVVKEPETAGTSVEINVTR